MDEQLDYLIIGSGIGGLCLAALLASSGYRVVVLERHYAPGGYGHSFDKKGANGESYTFCAQLHYLWNCGDDEDFGYFQRKIGLKEKIEFLPLNPNGFDRLKFPSFEYDIVKGFDRNIQQLAERYPASKNAITQYFKIISKINRELLSLPAGFGVTSFLPNPFKYPNLIKYRNWTTEKLFDTLKLPLEIRSILAGQSGDLLVPPKESSLLVQAALSCGYDSGACVPAKSYKHLFDTLVDYINSQPGCQVLMKNWVVSLEEKNGKIIAAHTLKKKTFKARNFVFNGDPKNLPSLLSNTSLPSAFQKKLNYEYSPSCVTLYLGIRNLDLTKYGFGDWNRWHYRNDDINLCFSEQLAANATEDMSLFMSTPTLHHRDVDIAVDNCHQLVVCTGCDYAYFKNLKTTQGRSAYLAEKDRFTKLIIKQIEKHYIPNLSNHLDLVIAGTPTTNEKFVLAPQGNAYGANLTPKQINLGKIDYRTPYKNLSLVGATANVPSFAGGVHYAIRLYEKMTGDRVLPTKLEMNQRLSTDESMTELVDA